VANQRRPRRSFGVRLLAALADDWPARDPISDIDRFGRRLLAALANIDIAVAPSGDSYTVEYRPEREDLPAPAESRSETGGALADVAMFAAFEPEQRQRVLAASAIRTYRAGELLFAENDPDESLIVLRTGAVELFRTGRTGERTVLYVIRAPETIGDISLLDPALRSASAEAIEDSTVLTLPRAAFLTLVCQDPSILDVVLRSLGALVRRLTEQPAEHMFLDLPDRVAKTLVRLAGNREAPTITIPLTASQIAELAGGSSQDVSRAISSFAGRGWLRAEGRQIVVIDLPALRRHAGNATTNPTPGYTQDRTG